MKFYKESCTRKQCSIHRLTTKNSTTLPQDETDATTEYTSKLEEELSETNLFKFADYADEKYQKQFLNVYSNFAEMNEHVISSDEVLDMCSQFRKIFPHCHDVFVLIVSTDLHRVELANVFCDNEDGDSNGLDPSSPATKIHKIERVTL